MVFHLRNAPDIDAVDCDELISFANRNFIAEMPRFQGNEYDNIGWWGNENDLTEDFKAKVLKTVCMHNFYNCAVAINGCKKDASDRCQHGYSRTETIPETYVNQMTDKIIYQHPHGHYNVWYD
jgi:hypothetical protein